MPESSEFWNFYWEMRLRDIDSLGKREVILAVSRLIRKLEENPNQVVRLLELGCGEGQIIGRLVEGHSQVGGINQSVGVDYLHPSIVTCRRQFPQMHFIEGDFTDRSLLENLGQFEIVLLVNALHEVFSAGYDAHIGEVNVPAAKQQVLAALQGAVERIAPGGWLALFDGLEMPGDPFEPIRLRFRHPLALEHFEQFAQEYHPFQITPRETGDPYCVELSRRDFTRYITKSIFLGKRLWQTEQLESYQYFNQNEFLAAITGLGLKIEELRTLTVDYEKWREKVEILTPGIDFPEEHILILARKP